MTLDRGDSPLAGRRPTPLSSVAGLNAINSLGSLGAMHAAGNIKPRGVPLGPLNSLNSGSLNSVNTGSLNSLGSSLGNSLGSSLGVRTNLPGGGSNPPSERNASSFWLDLQNVERWFDRLDTGERTTLLTSLFYRSPENQLHQFSSALDMAMRNQPTAASNLSQFGVRHNPPGPDAGSVFAYRPPLSAGGTSPQGKPAAQSSCQRPGSAVTPAGSGSAHGLSFSGASSASSDLYNNAFLPLPRSHPYSPWGTEIRRPNSASADVWPDARGSPLQSASNAGSPNISALSLETPQASSPSTHSPIGHPLKPWRTFAPQNAPLNINLPSQNSLQNSVQSPIGSIPSASAESPMAASEPTAHTAAKSVSSLKSACSVKSNSISVDFSAPGSPGQVPKDNRLARRHIDVVDAELLLDIGAWLRSLRLHKYTGNLSGMRWQDVILLSDKDLEDRGVNALGARRKLLKMFEEIRTAQEAGQLSGNSH